MKRKARKRRKQHKTYSKSTESFCLDKGIAKTVTQGEDKGKARAVKSGRVVEGTAAEHDVEGCSQAAFNVLNCATGACSKLTSRQADSSVTWRLPNLTCRQPRKSGSQGIRRRHTDRPVGPAGSVCVAPEIPAPERVAANWNRHSRHSNQPVWPGLPKSSKLLRFWPTLTYLKSQVLEIKGKSCKQKNMCTNVVKRIDERIAEQVLGEARDILLRHAKLPLSCLVHLEQDIGVAERIGILAKSQVRNVLLKALANENTNDVYRAPLLAMPKLLRRALRILNNSSDIQNLRGV